VGAGQFRMLRGAVPVDQALKEATLTAEQKERLALVDDIKAFGEHSLGLGKTQNYQTAYLSDSQAPIYLVSASPRDRLSRVTWWFPIAGRMPYLGFFDLAKAKAEKENLVEKELDVNLGRAASYSTLGWFKDPITLNLIEGSTEDLLETILHEMTHTTLYVKGQGEFNEGLAVLVGKVGAYQFLMKTHGPTHVFTMEAEDVIHDERLFASYIADLFQALEQLYDSDLTYEEKMTRRKESFDDALEEFALLKDRLRTERFDAFGSTGLNNAYLMSIGLYHRHFNLFEAVLRQKNNSIRNTIFFFQELAAKRGDILQSTTEWLQKRPGARSVKLL
jgi:predicted aminopeptidase